MIDNQKKKMSCRFQCIAYYLKKDIFTKEKDANMVKLFKRVWPQIALSLW